MTGRPLRDEQRAGASSCRHCRGDLIRCPTAPPDAGICAGWKHADYAESQPVISHYCGGRMTGKLAEPDVPWRTGRKVKRTIYEQTGPEPSDDDVLIGMMDTPEMAAEACAAHNWALTYRLALRRADAAAVLDDDLDGGPTCQPGSS